MKNVFLFLLLFLLPFSLYSQKADSGYLKGYSGYEMGYEYFNFNKQGGYLFHGGYFRIVRRDWVTSNPKKFVAGGAGLHLLGAKTENGSALGGRATAMLCLHTLNKKNWGDFPLIFEASYSHLANNSSFVNVSAGTSTVLLKGLMGLNYMTSGYTPNANRFQLMLGLKIQITSYQRMLY